MEICSSFWSSRSLWLSLSSHKTIYFDCINPSVVPYPLERSRPEKYKKYCEDEKCRNDVTNYNFTKRFLNNKDYVDKNETKNVPLVLYQDHSGYTSTMDWCSRNPRPEAYVENGTDEKKVLDIGDQAILSELQSQNNATAVTFTAILEKLESQNKELKVQNNATAYGFKAIVSELQSLKNLTAAQSHQMQIFLHMNDHVNRSGRT